MRHERAIIMILVYAIGFTTAYIAFSLPQNDKSNKHHNISVEYNEGKSVSVASQSAAAVTMAADGMFADVNGEEVIISGKLNDAVEPGPGFHYAIPFYEVSPNGNFIYYCEQQTEVPTECMEYVYEVATHTVHPVKVHGEQIVADTQVQQFVWNADESAAYDVHTSVSSATPWLFVD